MKTSTSNQTQTRRCGYCNLIEAPTRKLKACKACYSVTYCGVECQKKHYRVHKHHCRQTTANTNNGQQQQQQRSQSRVTGFNHGFLNNISRHSSSSSEEEDSEIDSNESDGESIPELMTRNRPRNNIHSSDDDASSDGDSSMPALQQRGGHSDSSSTDSDSDSSASQSMPVYAQDRNHQRIVQSESYDEVGDYNNTRNNDDSSSNYDSSDSDEPPPPLLERQNDENSSSDDDSSQSSSSSYNIKRTNRQKNAKLNKMMQVATKLSQSPSKNNSHSTSRPVSTPNPKPKPKPKSKPQPKQKTEQEILEEKKHAATMRGRELLSALNIERNVKTPQSSDDNPFKLFDHPFSTDTWTLIEVELLSDIIETLLQKKEQDDKYKDGFKWIRSNINEVISQLSTNRKCKDVIVSIIQLGDITIKSNTLIDVLQMLHKGRGDQFNNNLVKIIVSNCKISLESKDDYKIIVNEVSERVGKKR